MHPTTIRRAAVALSAVALAALATPLPAAAALDTDNVKLTDAEIDFGGSVYSGSGPVGSGNLTWDVVGGFYTPRLTGTLHMENAAGEYGRMHISYWDGGGNYIATRHGGTVEGPSDNSHDAWSVDLSPLTRYQIVEAHVCTEISSNGSDFVQVDCETYILN